MLDGFTCLRCRFVLEALEPIRLSAFAGATLRGGFGHAFKRTVCVWPPADCPRCEHRTTCSYPYIFETAPPPGATKLRTLDQVPRPYVIEPPPGNRVHAPGERFDFHLILIGRAIDNLPSFESTFQRLGEMGLGIGAGRFRVAAVHTETPPPLPLPPAPRLRLHFLSPTRIQTAGTLRTQPSFQDLTRALLRRLSSLLYFHCGRELQVDFRALIDQAAAIRTAASAVRWQEQSRVSGRQHRRIQMGGLVGTMDYEASTAESWHPYRPLLTAGTWVHVGKGAVMGLGRYRIDEFHAKPAGV